jgi:hypothetical protein
VTDGVPTIPDDSPFKFDQVCQANDAKEFNKALDTFHTCSGWDLKEIIETLPSAIVGSFIRCADLIMTDGVPEYAAIGEDLEKCAMALVGDNPLGDALRSFYLHPDKNCPCLQALSVSIPECELDLWPIPLMGSWLATSTCLLHDLGCDMFDMFCTLELEALEKCLPRENLDFSCASTLECGFTESLSLSMPSSMAGIPLPDACVRVYKEQGVGTKLLERYDEFRDKCGNPDFHWEAMKHTASPGGALTSTSESSTSSLSSSSSSTSSGGGFLPGMVAGLGLAAAIAVANIVYKRRLDPSSSEGNNKFRAIELTESPGYID